MFSLVERFELSISGGFFRHDGARLPWQPDQWICAITDTK
jgi:hypothetical protein